MKGEETLPPQASLIGHLLSKFWWSGILGKRPKARILQFQLYSISLKKHGYLNANQVSSIGLGRQCKGSFYLGVGVRKSVRGKGSIYPGVGRDMSGGTDKGMK